MRSITLLLIIFFMTSASIASALFSDSQVQNYVDAYNQRIDKAPDILKGLVKDEKINIDIIKSDGSLESVGFYTQNSLINRSVMGGIQDPTIVISATDGAIFRIKSSSDPIDTFQSEMKYGQVKIEGTTTWNKFKVSAVVWSLPVMKFFLSIFFG
jgi:hypothetical protein